jgi:hypothetical protein
MSTLLPRLVLGFPRTDPRVSPGTLRGAEKRGTPDALQEGMAAPKGVTASVLACRQGFLLTPKKTTHPTLQCTPPSSPPTSSRHHDLAITTAVSP